MDDGLDRPTPHPFGHWPQHAADVATLLPTEAESPGRPITMFRSLYFPRTMVFIIASLLPLAAIPQPVALPDIGIGGGALVTPGEQRRTGEAIMRNFRRAGVLLDDPLVTDYLNHLGYRLVSASDSGKGHFVFFIYDEQELNAFALPGGYIGINSGLLLATESESELASVVAHEIAHVTQNHYVRAYQFADQNSVPILAALIAAIILGSQGSELGSAALASLAANSVQDRINFTRENEKEADFIGIQLLANSGFNPNKMGDFFKKISRQYRLYGPSLPEFLRTHPVTESRLASARDRASQYKLTGNEHSSQNYYLMRARLKVFSHENKKALVSELKKDIKDKRYQNLAAMQYALALALTESRQFKQARRTIKSLIKHDPARIAYIYAHARLENLAAQYDTAATILQRALTHYPGNGPLTTMYAEILLNAGKARKAQHILLTRIENQPGNPVLYHLLADSEAKLNNNAGTHAAMGQYYYHIGLTHQAIEQMKLALKSKGLDFYNTTRIEARLQSYQEELEQLAKIEL